MKLKHLLSLVGFILTLLLSLTVDLNWLISIGVFFTFYFFFRLINGLGSTIPIQELMSMLLLVQFVIAPLVTFRYFDNQATFIMYVYEDIYFGYAIPAVLFFILGLNIKIVKIQYSYKDAVGKIEKLLSNNSKKAYSLIIVGFLFLFMSKILNVPSLFFVFYLVGLLRFIGAFMLVLSSNKIDFLVAIAVYVHFSIQIISGGVFYDLFVWLFFFYALIEFKWKSVFAKKLLLVVIGGVTIYFIQSFKADYRKEIWSNSKYVNQTEVFTNLAVEQLGQSDLFEEESNLDRFVSRLNTGWIVSKVMQHTPHYEPFVEGKLLKQDLINVFLPRFLFPNKTSSGGKENQEKFTRFTGRMLVGDTTMRIGAISDAYVNYGIFGGWVLLLLLGLTFNLVLIWLVRLSQGNPIYILWIPFIFAYAVRMSDIHVILNYTFKSAILMVITTRLYLNFRQRLANENK